MSILPTYKDISELLKKGLTIEAQEKIMELREAAIELQEENFTLKAKVKELEEALSFKGQLQRVNNVYYAQSNGTRVGGPYCLACWDGDRKLVNVMEFSYGVIKCGRCNKP